MLPLLAVCIGFDDVDDQGDVAAGLFQGSTRLRTLGDAGVEVLQLADEGAFPRDGRVVGDGLAGFVEGLNLQGGEDASRESRSDKRATRGGRRRRLRGFL